MDRIFGCDFTPSRPDPFALVIFGASGDLARRKLIPAIFSLFRGGLLPDDFDIVGFARTPMTDAEFREKARESAVRRCAAGGSIFGARENAPGDAGAGSEAGSKAGSKAGPAGRIEWCAGSWDRFARHMRYVSAAGYEDASAYRLLRAILDPPGKPSRNRLFYLAIQPSLFLPIVECLRANGLISGENADPWSRLVVEKPFGKDLASARALDAKLWESFPESRIFRIDHYLGKETVQNILVLRFANSIFEPLWNNRYVDHVQITIAETLGVEGRGGYYDGVGAIRDMIQNHAMQLLALVAMEPPSSLDPEAIRDEKVKVLRSLRPISRECVAGGIALGQYGAGEVEGRQVPSYREEAGVAPGSRTETFAALRVRLDNWRWGGVPFYIRTGKRLAGRVTEISLCFKPVPDTLFNLPPIGPMVPNVLALRIQPDEGVFLSFQVKVPGPGMCIRPFEMDFGYAETFGGETPDAYERLLLDALNGDRTLFARSDEVEAAWKFVSPIVEGCAAISAAPPIYPAGSWGPKEADDLIGTDGRKWRITRRRRQRERL
ncbi:MAG: glucose-6-phosphate dehydrogenase [Planctomycetota bacterium]|nr:glucose-6-phosphate dehydrogenase [Planctomycetota bacterium]